MYTLKSNISAVIWIRQANLSFSAVDPCKICAYMWIKYTQLIRRSGHKTYIKRIKVDNQNAFLLLFGFSLSFRTVEWIHEIWYEECPSLDYTKMFYVTLILKSSTAKYVMKVRFITTEYNLYFLPLDISACVKR